jgi:signal transduction histidine kinase/tetratricopeptide (TPR) repeat protein
MRSFYLLSIFLLLSFSAELVGDTYVDSLMRKIIQSEGVSKANALVELSNYITGKNVDESIIYARESYELSKSLNYKYGRANAALSLGTTYMRKGNFDSAEVWLKLSSKTFKESGNFDKSGEALLMCGWLYLENYNYSKAFSTFLDAKEIFVGIDDQKGVASLNFYLGRVYFAWSDFKKAEKHFLLALEYFTNSDDFTMESRVLMFLGQVYRQLGKKNESFAYLQKAFESYRKSNDLENAILPLRYIGEYYIDLGEYDTALQKFHQGVEIALNSSIDISYAGDLYTLIAHVHQLKGELEQSLNYNFKAYENRKEVGRDIYTASSLINIGHTFFHMKDYESALKYVDSGLAIAERLNFIEYQKSGNYKKFLIYEAQNDSKNALIYYKKFAELRNSIQKKETDQTFLGMQLAYESTQKDQENKILKSKNTLQKLYFYIIGAFLVIIILFILYLYRSKKKNQIFLEKQVESRTRELNSTLDELKNEINERILIENRIQRMNIELESKVHERTEQLEKAKNDLIMALQHEKKLVKIKTQFINLISHEYKTPMTIISSSSSLIKNYLKSSKFEKIEAHMMKIDNAILALNNLIEDVINYDKGEAGELDIVPVSFDAVKVFITAINEVRNMDGGKHHIEFKTPFQEMVINTDKSLLRQILHQLLINAIKFSDSGTLIKVELFEDMHQLIFSVEDNGAGISSDDQRMIFEPFFKSIKNIGIITGIGLGLSIVKMFVNALLGDIFVKSELGFGTKMTVKIPKQIHMPKQHNSLLN